VAKVSEFFLALGYAIGDLFSDKNGWRRTTPSTCNFVNFEILALENAEFQSIFARSAFAVIPSEKVQLSLIGGPLSAFQSA